MGNASFRMSPKPAKRDIDRPVSEIPTKSGSEICNRDATGAKREWIFCLAGPGRWTSEVNTGSVSVSKILGYRYSNDTVLILQYRFSSLSTYQDTA